MRCLRMLSACGLIWLLASSVQAAMPGGPARWVGIGWGDGYHAYHGYHGHHGHQVHYWGRKSLFSQHYGPFHHPTPDGFHPGMGYPNPGVIYAPAVAPTGQ